MSTCTIEGCAAPVRGQGLCGMHYQRQRRTGTTEPRQLAPLADRLRGRLDVRGPDDCWEWQGARHPVGHGQIASGLRPRHLVYTHRAMWELVTGRKLLPGEVVRHSCDNPPCCNPAHLLAGTQLQNVADMIARGRGWWQRV